MHLDLILILQRVSDWLAAHHVVLFMCPCRAIPCVLLPGYAAMCSSDYPALFLSPYPTHASGSLLLLQPVSDWLAAHHVVLVMCPVLFHVCCCLPMLARAPLTTLLCFLSPYPTHASGSLLILRLRKAFFEGVGASV